MAWPCENGVPLSSGIFPDETSLSAAPTNEEMHPIFLLFYHNILKFSTRSMWSFDMFWLGREGVKYAFQPVLML